MLIVPEVDEVAVWPPKNETNELKSSDVAEIHSLRNEIRGSAVHKSFEMRL